MFEIFVKSFMSFLVKAISALLSKKLELKKDFKDINKSSLDKIISSFLTKILGFWSLTARFNLLGLRYILVLLKSILIYLFISLALFWINPSNLWVSIPK
mgnify:CR=1 FL=1